MRRNKKHLSDSFNTLLAKQLQLLIVIANKPIIESMFKVMMDPNLVRPGLFEMLCSQVVGYRDFSGFVNFIVFVDSESLTNEVRIKFDF